MIKLFNFCDFLKVFKPLPWACMMRFFRFSFLTSLRAIYSLKSIPQLCHNFSRKKSLFGHFKSILGGVSNFLTPQLLNGSAHRILLICIRYLMVVRFITNQRYFHNTSGLGAVLICPRKSYTRYFLNPFINAFHFFLFQILIYKYIQEIEDKVNAKSRLKE